ncbi:MAG: sigma-70 family RNA polymerase sigma factor [Acidobacteria bacterium]|nr:sigma-70 family RNA polymerase sigma factor [Acidobacteriota bacterium]
MRLVTDTGHTLEESRTNLKSRPSDRELARLAAGGDAEAFEEIHRRHRRLVYAVALRLTGNPADAEDLTQDSFLALFRRIGTFRGEAAFTTWLSRLTTNRVLMHFRRRKSRPEDQTPDGMMPEPVLRAAPPAREQVLLDRIAIERAVNQLPPGYRATFIRHDVEGREHWEIARMTRRDVGTSKSQLHRARTRLRELLSERARLRTNPNSKR